MTDNEIIKALEHCLYKEHRQSKCTECEYVTGCKPYLMREALDLINRQKAEIEELTYKLECLLCHATGGKLSKSTYTLKTMECAVTDYINDCCYETDVETKAEAVKEFAEWLNKEAEKVYIDREGDFVEADGEIYDTVADWCKKTSDNIVKEMVGEE